MSCRSCVSWKCSVPPLSMYEVSAASNHQTQPTTKVRVNYRSCDYLIVDNYIRVVGSPTKSGVAAKASNKLGTPHTQATHLAKSLHQLFHTYTPQKTRILLWTLDCDQHLSKSSIFINRNPLSGSLSDTECCFRIRVLSDPSSPTSPHGAIHQMGPMIPLDSLTVCRRYSTFHSIIHNP